jgi:hypothetical protein
VPSFSVLSDGGAGAIFALIEHINASYPAPTYDELAFPRIAVSSLGEDAMKQLADSVQVTLEASLPAMGASLNCTLVPRDSMVKSRVVSPSAHILPGTDDSQVEFNTSLTRVVSPLPRCEQRHSHGDPMRIPSSVRRDLPGGHN